jgi:hypothetical protein
VANDEHALGLHVAEGDWEGRRLHSLQTVVGPPARAVP